MRFNTLLSLILLTGMHMVTAQAIDTANEDIWSSLSDTYSEYRYEAIKHRRFKHSDVMMRLDSLQEPFVVQTVGQSYEGRDIRLVSIGSGPVNVLLWSQMHGNEPTATMALMDVFGWLGASGDRFQHVRKSILSRLTLHVIPMLNPDGAQSFVRRNAQDIDINRDALRQQTPEGRILKMVRDSLEADWGFNLHDQRRSTGVQGKPATISFLAPAFDYDRSVNTRREDAMQLIAAMNARLQRDIPGQVGRYWDDFEPRAFGDNIQKWGTRTILIESGGQYGDREKQQIRKLNYQTIISSLYKIATGDYERYTVSDYEAIPNNDMGIGDVLLQNIRLSRRLGGYQVDLRLDFREVEDEGHERIYLEAFIEDLGDLSTSEGYIKYDLEGYHVVQGRVYGTQFANNEELKKYGQSKLLQRGFTDVKVEAPDYFDPSIYLNINKPTGQQIKLGQNPSLLFYKGKELEYALINGYLIDARWSEDEIIKGLQGL